MAVKATPAAKVNAKPPCRMNDAENGPRIDGTAEEDADSREFGPGRSMSLNDQLLGL